MHPHLTISQKLLFSLMLNQARIHREVGAYANIPVGKDFLIFHRKTSEFSKQFRRTVHCLIGVNILRIKHAEI